MYRKEHKDEYYTRRAHEEGYPARSVYKLQGINERFRIIKPGDKVLDLGSAPGSWLIYLSEILGKKGRAVGIDQENVDVNLPNAKFIKKDVLNLTEEDFKEIGHGFDAVLADLAPKTTELTWLNVGKSLELNETAFEICKKTLRKGGTFLTKVFDGDGVNDFIKMLQSHFQDVRRVKPPAVIKKSREFYILCKNYTPTP